MLKNFFWEKSCFYFYNDIVSVLKNTERYFWNGKDLWKSYKSNEDTSQKKKKKMKIIVFSALGISKVCNNLESVYTRKITDYW